MKTIIITLNCILACFLMITIQSCEQTQTEIEYFENGKIKSKAHIKNGLYHGEKKEYYENGNVLSKANYEDGKMSGKAFHYYPNGELKSSSTWIKDLENGTSQTFYENGTLMFLGHHDHGVLTDTSYLYFETGKLKELKIYEQGKTAFLRKLDENGDTLYNHVIPIFAPENDSISNGENYSITISFPFSLAGKITIDIGEITQDGVFKTDTTLIKKDNANSIKYIIQANRLGLNVFYLLLNHKESEDDLSVDGIMKKVSYFVEGSD